MKLYTDADLPISVLIPRQLYDTKLFYKCNVTHLIPHMTKEYVQKYTFSD